MHSPPKTTFLDVLAELASGSDSGDQNAVECAKDVLTYRQLWAISDGLSVELEQRYGRNPTIAIVSPNHPFILTLIFATWKLGGIVSLLDFNAPKALMTGMLDITAPTCVVMPSMDSSTKKIATDIGLDVFLYDEMESSIPALLLRFDHLNEKLAETQVNLPGAGDLAIYMFTSSASSISNLKAVGISHTSIYINCASQIAWLKATYGDCAFDRLRFLGWAPWSHIMGIALDIGTCFILTQGTYIFGVVPPNYPCAETSGSSVDAVVQEALFSKRPTASASVPWVLEGLMERWKAENDLSKRDLFTTALKKLKLYISGGAEASAKLVEWAQIIGIPLVVAIGMTELGGALFFRRSDDVRPGWPVDQCLINDAEFSLIDSSGNEHPTEGELWIKSNLITKGYHKFDSPAFSITDGRVTFRTGDVYCRTDVVGAPHLQWKGRQDDYIQLVSGEVLDPRILEKSLNSNASIARSCVVGDTFSPSSAHYICAIIEPAPLSGLTDGAQQSTNILAAIAAINRDLPPPLRIAWSRILLLSDGDKLPLTNKGALFRKKLSSLFGDQMLALLANPALSPWNKAAIEPSPAKKDEVAAIILEVICSNLRISRAIAEENRNCTFAELGMDSAMAVNIAGALSCRLNVNLPANTCHNYVDLESLESFVLTKLDLVTPAPEIVTTSLQASRPNFLEEVVIVGQALRLPGDLNTPESFWEALVDRRDDIIAPIPPDRWDQPSFYNASRSYPQPGDISFDKAGFVDYASFDNTFFGIRASEAMSISPSVRLALEVAYEALEDANILPSSLKGTDTAIIVANGPSDDYPQLLFLEQGFQASNRYFGTGTASSTICGRLSYLLDAHGPSLTVDTACSGGLVALDYAVRHLQEGEGESAIVCGINTHIWPGMFGFLSEQQMASRQGRCATFSSDADGYAPSEGAVALILKTRAAALRDGNDILGVVEASTVRHNGRSQGLVAPNVKAQISLQRALLKQSGLQPANIDLIEAHGTGTKLGDLMEMQGIIEVYRSSHPATRPLIVGASKTCVGHTEGAAGLVGIVKTLLSFKHNLVPGLVHLTDSNLSPEIDCDAIPMVIPSREVPLIAARTSGEVPPRHAMVLAFGFAGTISGVVLKDAPPSSHPALPTHGAENSPSSPYMIFVTSAKTTYGLMTYLERYLEFCLRAPVEDFAAICYTSCVGREHYKARFACVAKDMQDLIDQLKKELLFRRSVRTRPRNPRLVFGFPGQGCQFQGMARDLANQYSGFRSTLCEAAEMATAFVGFSVLPFLLEEGISSDLSIDENQCAQVCIFVYQYTVCKWLGILNIRPDSVIGHSIGEVAAAVFADALPFDVGLEFVVVRAREMRGDPKRRGAMAAVRANRGVIVQRIQCLGLLDHVVIAVYSSETSHVVSGDAWAVEQLTASLSNDGFKVSMLNVDQGFHSPCIEASLPSIQTWLQKKESHLQSPKLPFFSTLLGERLGEGQRLDSNYWLDHAKNPVKFVQATAAMSKDKDFNVILDVGPQPTMWSALQNSDNSNKLLLASCAKKGNNQEVALLNALAGLYEMGITADFLELYSQRRHSYVKTRIPTYPWQRQHHYPKAIPSRNLASAPVYNPDLASAHSQESRRWIIDQPLYDLLEHHRIEGRRVVPGVAFVIFIVRSSAGNAVNVQFHKPLVIDSLRGEIVSEVAVDKSFTISYESFGSPDKVCSGSIRLLGKTALTASASYRLSNLLPPSRIVYKEDVYRTFKHIYLGPLFSNIVEMRFWDDHVDALISAESSGDSTLDGIRKLDPCLHLFGPLAEIFIPESRTKLKGAYLPASLSGFAMHVETLPSAFTCRYFLPIQQERACQLISASFEVLSLTGERLVSCKRYSVAWIPLNVLHPPSEAESITQHWLQPLWVPKPLSPSIHRPPHLSQDLFYFAVDPLRVNLWAQLSPRTKQTTLVDLARPGTDLYFSESFSGVPNSSTLSAMDESAAVQLFSGRRCSFIIDATTIASTPHDAEFTQLCGKILSILRILMNGKIQVADFIVISSMATTDCGRVMHPVPEDLIAHSKTLGCTFATGSVIQGMIRVWRRECGLGPDVIWGFDLPSTHSISDVDVASILDLELQARRSHRHCDSIAAYRTPPHVKSPVRLVPILRPRVWQETEKTLTMSGITVITGMGSIGKALSSSFLTSGSQAIFFLGRTAATHTTVVDGLSRLREDHPGATIAYIQADVCSLESVVDAFKKITLEYGSITSIVHTAGVVKDAMISNVTLDAFNQVSAPKIVGSWNLHIASQMLGIELSSFVLLSSLSVPTGNPGQVAYVAGNSFLDSLASYRQSLSLPGVSLQLGAWESGMLDGLDTSHSDVSVMKHADGIPLVLRAMSTPSSSPVHLIASLDLKVLFRSSSIAKDPMFGELLSTRRSQSQTEFVDTPSNFAAAIKSLLEKTLELDELDLSESLTAYGVDSIAFAQLRGQILRDFEVELPMIFLSDAFSIQHIISHVMGRLGVSR